MSFGEMGKGTFAIREIEGAFRVDSRKFVGLVNHDFNFYLIFKIFYFRNIIFLNRARFEKNPKILKILNSITFFRLIAIPKIEIYFFCSGIDSYFFDSELVFMITSYLDFGWGEQGKKAGLFFTHNVDLDPFYSSNYLYFFLPNSSNQYFFHFTATFFR